MKLDVSVDITDDNIKAAVQEAVKRIFTAPQYSGDRGGVGWESIKNQAFAYVKQMDFTPLIDERVKLIVREVTANIVAAEITKHVKEEVRRRVMDGTLVS
jgi:hypothetical protein